MADTSLNVTEGSGKVIDMRSEATNGDLRQVVVLGDPSVNVGVAGVTNGTPTASDYALETRNLPFPQARTTNPSAASDGAPVTGIADKIGRTVTILSQVRQLVATQTTTISASTSETTVFTAVASTFLDLVAIVLINTSATAARVDFRDTTGGSVIFSLYAPAGQTTGFIPPVPIPQTTVNTNWTAQSSASVTDLRIFLQAVKNI